MTVKGDIMFQSRVEKMIERVMRMDCMTRAQALAKVLEMLSAKSSLPISPSRPVTKVTGRS